MAQKKVGTYPSFFMKFFFNLLITDIYADKTKMEESVANSKIKWEIVRPGILKDKPFTEKFKVETKLFKGIYIGSISRAHVEDFLVKQVENATELFRYVYYQISNIGKEDSKIRSF